jgi:hypothetical protein
MKIVAMIASAATLALGLVGCVPNDGPSMRPGEDCLSCHNGSRAGAWTVAGTVYSDPNAPDYAGEEGAQVIVTGADGKVLTLTSNSVGNFYTAEAIAKPFTVMVQRGSFKLVMTAPTSSGACSSCHNVPPVDGAPGRLFVPFTATAATRFMQKALARAR